MSSNHQGDTRKLRRRPTVFAAAILLFSATSLVTVSIGQVIKFPLIRNPHGHLAQIRQDLRFIGKRDEHNEARLPLDNSVNKEFFVQVEVGTPPQTFNLTLDTSSASLWVPSTECSDTGCPNGRYVSSKSSTFQNSNTSFSLNYNVGTVNGTYCTESVSLSGFTIPNQTVALASADNISVFTDYQTDNGVIGFAYPRQNAARGFFNDVPFFFNLVDQGHIAKPVFSLSLDSDSNSGGELMLGGIDASKYNGTLHYAPILLYSISSGQDHSMRAMHAYWAVGGVGVETSAGYKSALRTVEEFVIDTASTLTYTPHAESIIKSLNLTYTVNSVPDVYVVNCDSRKTLQDATVTFKVARTLLGSRARRFNNPIKVTVSAQDLFLPGDAETLDKATACLFAIAPAKEVRTIIGASLLRSVYTVYDTEYDRIGFAAALNSSSSL